MGEKPKIISFLSEGRRMPELVNICALCSDIRAPVALASKLTSCEIAVL